MRFSILAPIYLLLSALVTDARADGPSQLPGTEPLTETGDLASAMVEGIDRFLSRKIQESPERRRVSWKHDTSSLDAYAASIAPDRKKLANILGIRDARPPRVEMEILATTRAPSPLVEDETLRVSSVRWPALEGVHGEGLLLEPRGSNRHVADVIVIPDASQVPEELCGLAPGSVPEASFALRLARSGCRVLIPVVIDRGMNERKITNREFLYRPSFELGRHVIGYEIQKILAGVDWFASEMEADGKKRPVGVMGWGDGGMLAFYSAALDTRIEAALVSGYIGIRETVWSEPIDRNLFGILQRFGDAEVAAMIAPRDLIIDAATTPQFFIPPGTNSAPGRITKQTTRDTIFAMKPVEAYLAGVVHSPFPRHASGKAGEAARSFLSALAPDAILKVPEPLPKPEHLPDAALRHTRQIREIDRHTQDLLEASADVRSDFFKTLDTSSLDAYARTIEPFRKVFDEDIIGKFDDPRLPLNARSRKVFDEARYAGYEVKLDVFPDVFAYGILLVPKDITPGERRPVVVCQHGLEGRPNDVADPRVDNPAYHHFAIRLAERGFVTFAPQNPYIFKDRFRTLQRKANPLGKTLFSIIVPQHRQIVTWLKAQDFVDPDRIAFYGLSYGGKSAMRIPALVTDYRLSICSADFNEWIWKNASTKSPYSYVRTGEYEIFEFNLGNTFNYAEMASLIAPRPFMVERGHFDPVAPDEKVAHEYAKVRRLYNGLLEIGDRTAIEFFDGPHTFNGVGTFEFLQKHLNWPERHP